MLPQTLPESERRRCDKAWGLALRNYAVVDAVILAGRNVRNRERDVRKRERDGRNGRHLVV
jgi:hypothetical protein